MKEKEETSMILLHLEDGLRKPLSAPITTSEVSSLYTAALSWLLVPS